jgi:hypothetical protein
MSFLNPYGTVKIATNVTPFPSRQDDVDATLALRCDVAVDFLKSVVPGPWVLDSPGKGDVSGAAARFTDRTEPNMREFMMARMRMNRPVGLLLPKADAFVKGSSVPIDALGRCNVLCVEVEGNPVDCRIQAEAWEESSATLMMPSGLIFMWWLHKNTDWKTANHAAEIIAAGFSKANASKICFLPGVTPGVQIIDVNTNAYYLDEFSRPKAPEPESYEAAPARMMPDPDPIANQPPPPHYDEREPSWLRIRPGAIREG